MRRSEIPEMFHKQITDGLLMLENYKENEDDKIIRSRFFKHKQGNYVVAEQWHSFLDVYGIDIKSSHIMQYKYDDVTRKHLKNIKDAHLKVLRAELEAKALSGELAELKMTAPK